MKCGRTVFHALLSSLLLLAACATQPSNPTPSSNASTDNVEKFLADAEKRYLADAIKLSRASWVKSNFITDDSEALEADANKGNIALVTELAEAARKFEGQNLSPDAARKLKLLKLALTLPAPKDEKEREELTKIAASMEGDYGKGKYCPDPTGDPLLTARVKALAAQSKNNEKKCLDLGDLEKIIGESRNPEELKRAWMGWHQVAQQYRQRYTRFVELANKGAKEMGFKDVGAMWRANYDMEPDAFAAEMERLWLQSNRSTIRCTLTCGQSCDKNTATRCQPMARFRRICSAICGHSSGAISTKSSSPRQSRRKPTT